MVSLLSQSVADRPLLLQGCGGTIGQDRPKVKKGKKEVNYLWHTNRFTAIMLLFHPLHEFGYVKRTS